MPLKALTAGLVACLALAVIGCGTPAPPEPVVKKIDHIMVNAYDAPALFNLFTEVLGLPVAWPMANYPGYQTGGVRAGNVNIEFLHYDSTSEQSSGPGKTLFYGIVLEPDDLEEVTPLLEERGAKPSKPEPQTAQIEGKTVTLWTNVTLDALCYKSYIVYLCEYAPEVKARMGAQASTEPMGGMGLESMSEVGIVSKDSKTLQEEWETVFAPDKMSKDGVISIGSGPAVRISNGQDDAFARIVLAVGSLETARAFLQEKGLLGASTSTELTLEPSKVQGLDIRVIEKKGS